VASAGGVLVATCHRVELLLDAVGDLDPASRAALVDGGATLLKGRAAARHVIRLGLGLESVVVGEDQVLHQVRTAVADARRRAPIGLDLGLLLDATLRAGRLGRSWRPAQGADLDTSLADLAIGRVESQVGALDGRRIVIVGAGEIGRAAARRAIRRGVRVGLASPTPEHAVAVAAEVGADPWSMDFGVLPADVAGVVVALSGVWAMSDATAAALARCPIVVDLSMPPALPAEVRAALGDRLIDIDGLAASGPAGRATARYRSRLERLADGTLGTYLAGLAARERPGVDRLAERIERQRAAEVEAWLGRRPDLDADARRQLEELTRDLALRLFREPLARLASDPDGRRRRALDELFGA
jgi:glutamyl-tRNA reductase